jgi:hypothetical protein
MNRSSIPAGILRQLSASDSETGRIHFRLLITAFLNEHMLFRFVAVFF